MRPRWMLAAAVACGLVGAAAVLARDPQQTAAPKAEGAQPPGARSERASTGEPRERSASERVGGAAWMRPGEVLETPPPPFSDGVYPCTFCHDETLKTNPKRRFIEDHEDIKLKHDENRWCLDCHDANNRDVLHLASGDPLPFEESYKLCGQCHGEKYRDWRAGVHGRRTGRWNGQKGYLLCVHCHSPHEPHFKPMAPKAAPVRPTRPR